MTPVEELNARLDAAKQVVAELKSSKLKAVIASRVDLDDIDSVRARIGVLYDELMQHEPTSANNWIDIDDQYVDSFVVDQIPGLDWMIFCREASRGKITDFIRRCDNLLTLWCILDLLEKAIEFAYHGPSGPRCILRWSCEWDSEKREFIYTGDDEDED
jgi:hypothetical protein